MAAVRRNGDGIDPASVDVNAEFLLSRMGIPYTDLGAADRNNTITIREPTGVEDRALVVVKPSDLFPVI